MIENKQYKNEDDVSSLDLCQFKVQEHDCNINRQKDELVLLTQFSHISPDYDDENGVHLKLGNGKIINLKDHICNSIEIENGQNMTDKEYYQEFIERKRKYVDKHLIQKSYSMGYETPLAVQSIVIPELIQRKDALIQFKSGTGKTHAFLCGLLWGFDPTSPTLQYIFMTSSHEIATQIHRQVKALMSEEIKISLCIGHKKAANTGGFKDPISTSSFSKGTKSLYEEKKEIAEAQIIVCTMGKLYDFLYNRKFIPTTKYLKAICIDEFDTIVVSKSKPRSSTIISTEEQMARIIEQINTETNGYAQRVFFSATITENSLSTAFNYFRPYNVDVGEPLVVLLNTEDYTLEGIKQYYVSCTCQEDKLPTIIDLLKQCRVSQGIIFTNKITTANQIKRELDNQEIPFSNEVFHSDLPAVTRQRIYKEFLENRVRILISTDVTSRGVDVTGINVVFNYDMPNSLETYIHRVGRSGRHGKKGVAISLILCDNTINEMEKVETINSHSKNGKMEPLPSNLDELL